MTDDFCCCVLDVQQSLIGSCTLDDVAVRVLSRVIGHCPHRNQLLIDCGWSGLRYIDWYFTLFCIWRMGLLTSLC